MAKRGTTDRYVYLIVSNDEFELPCFITTSVKEAADFLGITTGALYGNVCRGFDTIGGQKRRYRLIRMLEVKKDNDNGREVNSNGDYQA